MSTSLRDALLFVTLALGAAIKRIFIYVTYILKNFILPVFMSLIKECLLLKLHLLMKHFSGPIMKILLLLSIDT